jgi:hypothetical protein
MKINGDDVTFESTGRKGSANFGIIGIGPTEEMVFGGYDWEFLHLADLKPEERNELANHMIARWERFRGPK